ncbi:hypothetical protein RDI58_001048 [Solanum bulbocastanum]|uniref:Uncharacterized protein n=1 Tax=Solanum bulbocastanum TaxID=147425 RepID=A0AAN8YPQ6_SOLBU
MTLLESDTLPRVGRYLLALVEDKNLFLNLLTLIEQGSAVLKGKALIFVALLCMNGKRWLPLFFCNAKLLSTVDRLVKKKDDVVKYCLDSLGMVAASTGPSLLEGISRDIGQLKSGKHRGQIINVTSSNSFKNSMHLFLVVLDLLGYDSLKRRLLVIRFCNSWQICLNWRRNSFPGPSLRPEDEPSDNLRLLRVVCKSTMASIHMAYGGSLHFSQVFEQAMSVGSVLSAEFFDRFFGTL